MVSGGLSGLAGTHLDPSFGEYTRGELVFPFLTLKGAVKILLLVVVKYRRKIWIRRGIQ